MDRKASVFLLSSFPNSAMLAVEDHKFPYFFCPLPLKQINLVSLRRSSFFCLEMYPPLFWGGPKTFLTQEAIDAFPDGAEQIPVPDESPSSHGRRFPPLPHYNAGEKCARSQQCRPLLFLLLLLNFLDWRSRILSFSYAEIPASRRHRVLFFS